jgi:polysaccharide transporter, PST family
MSYESEITSAQADEQAQPLLRSSQLQEGKADRLKHSLVGQGLERGVRLLSGMVVGGIVARYLGPSQLGKLAYVSALVGILGPIGSLGLTNGLIPVFIEDRRPELVSTALVGQVIGTGCLMLLLIPFWWTTEDSTIRALLGIAVIGNLFGSAEIFEKYLLAIQRGTQIAKVNSWQNLIGSSMMLLAVVGKGSLLLFGCINAAKQGLIGLLLYHRFRVEGGALQWGWKARELIQLLRRGFPLLLAGLSIMIYMKSDQVMLGWLKGSEAVGQYSVAVTVAESIYFLPVVLATTYLPKLLGLKDQKIVQTRKLYRLAWVMGVGLMLASMTVLPLLLRVVYGEQYIASIPMLIALGPAAFAVATGCASGAWLQAQGLEWIATLRTTIGAAANIILNLFLIPVYGGLGAGIATSISYFISVFLITYLIKSTRENTIILFDPR